MAPTLRSSAPNTPNSKFPSVQTPANVTPRKTPSCTKCKRPKAGHPRSGCPYTDTQTFQEKEARAENTGQNIVDALDSMHLQSPSREASDNTRATIRQRRRTSMAAALATTQSVVSLDTESRKHLDGLMQPGMFDDNPEDRTHITTDKVVQWQETLTRKRIKMPCSLSSPSPYSSQESIKLEEPSPAAPVDIPNKNGPVMTPTANFTPSASVQTIRSLNRTMSMEQRETFFSNLDNNSNATICVAPRNDIYNIQADAIKVGLYTRVVSGRDTTNPQDFLILGQNEAAVKRVQEQLEGARKQSTGIRAATAGAVVGAVGAFAGLAFS
ncbi:hypothetical protein C0992_013044 [Termitomyces sp. T32_za158]|nr:hypothetical protein C0992_013044 [Termitomyces sp. T32_za158]